MNRGESEPLSRASRVLDPRGEESDAEPRADRPAGDAEQHVPEGPVGGRAARDEPDRDDRDDRERQGVAGEHPAPRVGGGDQGRQREQHDHDGDRHGGEQLLPQAAADADELGDVR